MLRTARTQCKGTRHETPDLQLGLAGLIAQAQADNLGFDGRGGSLSAHDALDIAAYLNDQPRGSGMADQMFCPTESDGIPGPLRKPASWAVGCEYEGEPFSLSQKKYGPWKDITDWRNAEIARLKAGFTQ